jgi:hypothetical protein
MSDDEDEDILRALRAENHYLHRELGEDAHTATRALITLEERNQELRAVKAQLALVTFQRDRLIAAAQEVECGDDSQPHSCDKPDPACPLCCAMAEVASPSAAAPRPRGKKFMDRVMAGDVKDPDREIDDAITQWHDAYEELRDLHEYLGMTWDEYRLFVRTPQALRVIIAARQDKDP